MASISSDKLRCEIQNILKDADLNTLSSKKVRQMLEALFKCDFTERKKEIDDILMAEITTRDTTQTNNDEQDDDDDKVDTSDDEKPPPSQTKKIKNNNVEIRIIIIIIINKLPNLMKNLLWKFINKKIVLVLDIQDQLNQQVHYQVKKHHRLKLNDEKLHIIKN